MNVLYLYSRATRSGGLCSLVSAVQLCLGKDVSVQFVEQLFPLCARFKVQARIKGINFEYVPVFAVTRRRTCSAKSRAAKTVLALSCANRQHRVFRHSFRQFADA